MKHSISEQAYNALWTCMDRFAEYEQEIVRRAVALYAFLLEERGRHPEPFEKAYLDGKKFKPGQVWLVIGDTGQLIGTPPIHMAATSSDHLNTIDLIKSTEIGDETEMRISSAFGFDREGDAGHRSTSELLTFALILYEQMTRKPPIFTLRRITSSNGSGDPVSLVNVIFGEDCSK